MNDKVIWICKKIHYETSVWDKKKKKNLIQTNPFLGFSLSNNIFLAKVSIVFKAVSLDKWKTDSYVILFFKLIKISKAIFSLFFYLYLSPRNTRYSWFTHKSLLNKCGNSHWNYSDLFQKENLHNWLSFFLNTLNIETKLVT